MRGFYIFEFCLPRMHEGILLMPRIHGCFLCYEPVPPGRMHGYISWQLAAAVSST
jgi:hypothetical protein